MLFLFIVYPLSFAVCFWYFVVVVNMKPKTWLESWNHFLCLTSSLRDTLEWNVSWVKKPPPSLVFLSLSISSSLHLNSGCSIKLNREKFTFVCKFAIFVLHFLSFFTFLLHFLHFVVLGRENWKSAKKSFNYYSRDCQNVIRKVK